MSRTSNPLGPEGRTGSQKPQPLWWVLRASRDSTSKGTTGSQGSSPLLSFQRGCSGSQDKAPPIGPEGSTGRQGKVLSWVQKVQSVKGQHHQGHQRQSRAVTPAMLPGSCTDCQGTAPLRVQEGVLAVKGQHPCVSRGRQGPTSLCSKGLSSTSTPVS